MADRLTEPQHRLLNEMRESSTGGLWIRRSGRYWVSAWALSKKGYARMVDRTSTSCFFVPEPQSDGAKS